MSTAARWSHMIFSTNAKIMDSTQVGTGEVEGKPVQGMVQQVQLRTVGRLVDQDMEHTEVLDKPLEVVQHIQQDNLDIQVHQAQHRFQGGGDGGHDGVLHPTRNL